MRGGELTFSCGVCVHVHRRCPLVASITYATHEAETWICEYERGVVDDERPTKENKREVRGGRSSPSLVSTSIGVVPSPPTQRMRDADNYVEGGDGEWWTTRGMRRRRGREV